MITHSHCNFLMDWEPAESHCMAVDEKGPVDVPMTEEPFSSADCDVYMAPTTVQEVHMASPILTSQPPTIAEINCGIFLLPPFELKTKFNIHAFPRQALELRDSPFICMPAVATYQAESPTMASASSQGDACISTVHNYFPYCPVTPSRSEFIPTPQDLSPILMSIDNLEIGDSRAATPSPLFESTSPPGWPLDYSRYVYMPAVATYQADSPTMDSASSQGDACTSAVHNHFPSNPVYCPVTLSRSEFIPTPQDLSPIFMSIDNFEIGDTRAATPSPLFESTSSPGWPDRIAGPGDIAPNDVCVPWPDWIEEQDVTPSTPYLVVETNTPEDDSILRAFGGSSLEDLDWILEGFRATSVADACIESKNASNSEVMFVPALHNFSPVSPYDWAVSETSPDLISFDAAHNLCHNIHSGSFELPSFNSGDVIQTEFNGFFQASTPAPYNRSAYEESPDVQKSHSPLDPFVIFSKAACRNTPRSTKKDASTQTEEFPDVKSHTPFDPLVFSKAVCRNAPRSTKKDASTRKELPGATYGLRPSRRYSPCVRYSPYRKLSRDFTFGSSGSGDLESAQPTITSGTSCGLPSLVDNVFLDCSILASITSERELEAMPAVCVNLREDDQEKEMSFPGAYPIEQVAQPAITSGTSCGLPSPVDNVFLDYSIQVSIVSERELEARPAVCVNLREPEEDDQGKEMSFPGAYPFEQVVYALNEPAKLSAGYFVKVTKKNHFETEVFSCPTVHPSAQYGFKELFSSIFTYFFDW